MVYDVVTYNGEKYLLDLRLNILSPFVDKFIICEAKTTFSGFKKHLYFMRDEQFFHKFWPKIEFFVINENWTPAELQLAETSPNTRGAAHWKHEFLQKEKLKQALIDNRVQDADIVYIGDVDEIWQPYTGQMPAKLKLKVFAYQLDTRSNEEFWGTVVAPWAYLKDKCLNHVRSDVSLLTKDYWGWHFTSMGGLHEVRRKLNDSYTPDSYNTYSVQELLPERLRQGIDYLGRPFSFTQDISEWPEYLKENYLKYQHLCTFHE